MSDICSIGLGLGALVTAASAQTSWKPAECPIPTQWSKDVDPQNVHPEYPRPQFERKDWLNLNGLWDLSLASKRAEHFEYDQKILVPFPVESSLSGVKGRVDDDTIIRYRRTFEIPPGWAGKRVLMHFGAVDWETAVSVNGKLLGDHRGGYDPFSFDITSALKPSGTQTVEVVVTDPTDTGTQPRGKQVLNPEGIFYTPTSGIWQTVWLEPVPEKHIKGLSIVTDPEQGSIRLRVDLSSVDFLEIHASAIDSGKVVAESKVEAGHDILLRIPHARLWSPQSAFLYRVRISLVDKASQATVDEVDTYTGIRKITVQNDHGVKKIFLNGKPIFLVGTLDQGFWPDGVYTPPTDEAMRHDLFTLKSLGFNTVRKHVKVEPSRWYYWCDKMGLLVWQDMPSGDKFIGPNDPDIKRSPESAQGFETELAAMIRTLRNHPCIVIWTLFNEGWGQYDTARLTKWIKSEDPTRLVDSASGWADRGTGDLSDMHSYPGPGSPKPEESRAAVLGEFGGLGLPVKGHTWSAKGWSYQGAKNQDELTNHVVNLFENLRMLQTNPGLSGAIYTQTTDVETELNGLMTYDRAVLKVDQDKLREAIMALYQPPPMLRTVVPTSQDTGYSWKYTTYQPADGWQAPDFDDSQWALGMAGFGTKDTPGSSVRTTWDGSDIWLRRTFNVSAKEHWHQADLLIHHDDDAEVYIDGQQVASLPGYFTSYRLVPIKDLGLLKPGQHTLAIHCRQVSGGQYIDAGIVDVEG